MFVLIFLLIGSKSFPPSVTNIKRIVNFNLSDVEVLQYLLSKIRKPTINREHPRLSIMDNNVEICRFPHPKGKRKRFMSICYNFSFSF